MKDACVALVFLTFGRRMRISEIDPRHIGAAVPYLPLTGILLGLVLVLVNRLVGPYLESEIIGATLVALQALMTAAIHYAGLQRTFDSLSIKINFTDQTKAQSGVFSLLVIVLVVLLKVRSLEVIGETRYLSLLLTPMLARWALVVFVYGSGSVAEGPARIIAEKVTAWHLLLISVVALGLATYVLGEVGLWFGLYLSLFALLSRSYLRRRNGCIRFDNFGAVVELSETLGFILFASL
jgi:adenosylcobinamide-GDP ribazoletransferase